MKSTIKFLVLFAITGVISSTSIPALNKAMDSKNMLVPAYRPGTPSDYPKDQHVVLTVPNTRQQPTVFTSLLNMWKDPGVLTDNNMGSPTETDSENTKGRSWKKGTNLSCAYLMMQLPKSICYLCFSHTITYHLKLKCNVQKTY